MGCGRRDEACRYPGSGRVGTRLLPRGRQKKTGRARFLRNPGLGSDESCVAKTTADLRQFRKRKFLNFNDFQDVVHVAPYS